MPKAKKQVRQFNLMLSEEEHQQLKFLSEKEGASAGHVLRMCLRARYACSQGQMCCGDSTPCFVPQMHAARKIA